MIADLKPSLLDVSLDAVLTFHLERFLPHPAKGVGTGCWAGQAVTLIRGSPTTRALGAAAAGELARVLIASMFIASAVAN